MAANKLSCQTLIKTDLEEVKAVPDIDKFILAEFNYL